MEMNVDPMEGSSYDIDVRVKTEIKDETDDEIYNPMDILELAQHFEPQEPLEYNSTDAMVNPKTGVILCLHCLAEISTATLNDHMVTVHNYRRVLFKCSICSNKFEERNMLMMHKRECQPEVKRKRKTFQQILKEVETDLKNDTGPTTCPFCALELPTECLKEHLNSTHKNPDINLNCERCHRTFKSRLTLREHVKLVHNAVEDSVECELCSQKFSSYKYLSNHKRNVHPKDNIIHKCHICAKEFKSRLCLHQHKKYVHPPKSASVECPHCPSKVFKSKINLQQHLKVSHGYQKRGKLN